MRPTFEQTVNVLVQAYLKETLKHGDDCCCAVGNLICEGMKLSPLSNWGPKWYNYFVLNWRNEGLKKLAYGEINSTGYTANEIVRIEHAFEHADGGNNSDEYMFNGLMAVVDVLAEIHNVDLSVREEAKLLFVK